MECDGRSPGDEEEHHLPDDPSACEAWDTHRELGRSLGGDASAKDAFCRRYMDQVARWIRTHARWQTLSRRYEVADLVGELWRRVLNEGGWERFTYRGKGSFEAWLRCIVDHALEDLTRRNSAQKRDGGDSCISLGIGDEGAGGIAWGGSREPTPTEAARVEEILEQARETLNDDEFHAWYRRDYLGYSHLAVSRVLGRSEAAVRGLVHRARKKLQERFEP